MELAKAAPSVPAASTDVVAISASSANALFKICIAQLPMVVACVCVVRLGHGGPHDDDFHLRRPWRPPSGPAGVSVYCGLTSRIWVITSRL
ncbi:MAG: hypothetical protein H0W08_08555 [Acidobacteria bacterium]|nr:hypothetical protein [Acidobacteriota bacterium]